MAQNRRDVSGCGLDEAVKRSRRNETDGSERRRAASGNAATGFVAGGIGSSSQPRLPESLAATEAAYHILTP
jgi:hypothetical protein